MGAVKTGRPTPGEVDRLMFAYKLDRDEAEEVGFAILRAADEPKKKADPRAARKLAADVERLRAAAIQRQAEADAAASDAAVLREELQDLLAHTMTNVEIRAVEAVRSRRVDRSHQPVIGATSTAYS